MKEKGVCRCEICAQEQQKGELCYRIEGNCICPDCLGLFAQRYFRAALEVL